MFCPKCGSHVDEDNAVFCGVCGYSLYSEQGQESEQPESAETPLFEQPAMFENQADARFDAYPEQVSQRKSDNKTWYILASVLAVVVLATAVLFVWKGEDIGDLFSFDFLSSEKDSGDRAEKSEHNEAESAQKPEQNYEDDVQSSWENDAVSEPLYDESEPATDNNDYYESEYSGSKTSVTITSELQRNVNIFLSNYSEVGLNSFDEHPSVSDMIFFGLEHNLFNNNYAEEDECYFNGDYYNMRMSIDRIKKSVSKFFNYNLSDSDFDKLNNCRNGYYYWFETGGGFYGGDSVVYEIYDIGNNEYLLRFKVYSIDALIHSERYGFSENQVIQLQKEDEYVCFEGSGEAVIRTTNLNDRSKYSIRKYTIKWDHKANPYA